MATFEANVTLTAETFADYKTLHLYDLSFEEYVEAASSSIKKRCREREHQRVIGWHFKRFTASKTGVVFVPSSQGSQDWCCFFQNKQNNILLYYIIQFASSLFQLRVVIYIYCIIVLYSILSHCELCLLQFVCINVLVSIF